jgi:hypothetical protein
LKIQHKNMAQFVARLLHGYIPRYEPLRSPLPPLNQSSYTNFSFHDWPSLPHPASYFFVATMSGSSRFPVHQNLHGWSGQIGSFAIRQLLLIPPRYLRWPQRVPRAINFLPRGLASGHHQYYLYLKVAASGSHCTPLSCTGETPVPPNFQQLFSAEVQTNENNENHLESGHGPGV